MAENKHTAGEWLVDPVSARVVVPDRDAPICALLWPTHLRSEDETYANARLIAAAPDLLEACRALVAAMRRYEVEVDGDAPQSHRDMMEHADAAIARSTQPGEVFAPATGGGDA